MSCQEIFAPLPFFRYFLTLNTLHFYLKKSQNLQKKGNHVFLLTTFNIIALLLAHLFKMEMHTLLYYYYIVWIQRKAFLSTRKTDCNFSRKKSLFVLKPL